MTLDDIKVRIGAAEKTLSDGYDYYSGDGVERLAKVIYSDHLESIEEAFMAGWVTRHGYGRDSEPDGKDELLDCAEFLASQDKQQEAHHDPRTGGIREGIR